MKVKVTIGIITIITIITDEAPIKYFLQIIPPQCCSICWQRYDEEDDDRNDNYGADIDVDADIGADADDDADIDADDDVDDSDVEDYV